MNKAVYIGYKFILV